MIRFFKKLFKRGDFMTRADKAYYKYRAKTIFWSAFCLIIIAWVGTNLVLCALTTNVESGGDIIYHPAKDIVFISGEDFQKNYMTTSTKSITFDRYTNEINAKIAGLQGTEVVEGIMYYNVGNDLYFLSNDNIVANENCYKMFCNRIGSGRYLWDGVLQKIVLNNFDTKNVTNMQDMFSQSYKLQEIVGLNRFDTSNVTTMERMFLGCHLLTSVDVSSFDTSHVTTMEEMFESCELLTNIDVSSFDTKNVTSMKTMFSFCTFKEIDVSSFDTSSLKLIGTMFGYNENLTTIYASDRFTTSSLGGSTIYDTYNVFAGCTSLVGGKGTKCNGKNYDAAGYDFKYARIDDPDNGKPGYFTEKPYSGK